MEGMFFALILAAIFAYGVQIPMIAVYARRFDAITVAIYRNISLVFTMLPILFFVPSEQFAIAVKNWPYFLLMGVIGACSYIAMLTSSIYLPVGIAQSFRQASNIIAAILLGVLFLSEILSAMEFGLIALLLIGSIALSLSKPNVLHLERQNVSRGVWLAIAGGAGGALSFLFFSQAARSVSPIIAAYALEAGVGISILLYALARSFFFKKRLVAMPLRDAAGLVAISLTTIIGTLSFAYAVTLGSFALATALLSAGGIVALVIAWWLYGERLTLFQLGVILYMIAIIVVLRLTI